VYQTLLTRRYLTSKIMPLLAAVAVMLCVATELVVWSIMGGFKDTLIATGRSLIGDVSIQYAHTGIGHYEDLLTRLRADPMVEAATPVVETFGLLSLPLGLAPETVSVRGIDGPSFDKVARYDDSLWWRPMSKPLPKDSKREDPRLDPAAKEALQSFLDQGRTLTATDGRAAMVIGTEVGGYNERAVEGFLRPLARFGDPIPAVMRGNATLSMMPLDRDGRVRTADQKTLSIPIVNQFKSGLYEIDANVVFVRLDILQKYLKMDEGEAVAGSTQVVRVIDPLTGKETFEFPKTVVRDPARATHVLVRAKDKIAETALRERCREIYAEFAAAHKAERFPPPPAESVRVLTWRDRNRTLIEAVEKEIGVVMVIFGIVSFTSVFLILAIFWAMVREKTRDIGILRAIGASGPGVAWIWISYGLAIGVVGAVLGTGAAYLLVTNINEVHEWLGRAFGVTVWNPRVYYFTEIPHHVRPENAAIVLVSGVLASVLGALIPAVKAARMDPVKSLRWE
jgi:lipoprotein-releasing system permease protein